MSNKSRRSAGKDEDNERNAGVHAALLDRPDDHLAVGAAERVDGSPAPKGGKVSGGQSWLGRPQ